ncbi:hypothetical protein BpJC7_22560 [Weizmannia acidilactici]|uniref:Uncharacterized protein n=1 Tax=Weizmannia acidilactici TaxID=2607726 RepID=A0A5J4JFQ7_9BACI|nr:sigma-G-dependent sporulation-specific acid-soluble spore protein CsgA [Weizmannia acidilactici]GER68110.1 hypothetical protein BpJC4_25810 [Weizmannia acidilactici]GER70953.1 hypothetical protein BpJC7_22560 [Weizmannia acidilactici]GER73932.1 hypothetical protein BpPP18_19990 [Weizmannia acidilactici]
MKSFSQETHLLEEFRGKNETETAYLNEVLQREMDYAKQAQDQKRLLELNEVFVLLT